MSRGAEHDQAGPSAPLLSSDAAGELHHEGDHDDHYSRAIIDPGINSSGGWFIWALTFSAGISGLLFGYEYAPGHPCECEGKRKLTTRA